MRKIKKLTVIMMLVIFSISVLTGCGGNTETNKTKEAESLKNKSLFVFSGAGLRKPMDEIGEAFTEKYGVKIEYSYAGSAQNLSQIELSGKGDVYVAGALYYYKVAREKGLAEEKKDVAYHIPVIMVPKGNPANIEKLEDMGRPGVKVVLGDEKSAAIGEVSAKILKENGLSSAVAKNTIAKAPTVNELVVYITMKQADAAIAWEDNAMGVKEVEIVKIPEEINQIKTIPVCVLKNSEKKELARQFVNFVTSKEGKNIFKKHGFKPVE